MCGYEDRAMGPGGRRFVFLLEDYIIYFVILR